MKAFHFGLLAVTFVACPAVHAISGDKATEATDHPEAVLVRGETAGGKVSLSSGALIAPRAVLTAAHGVAGRSRLTVVAPYAPGGKKAARVTAVRLPPRYDPDNIFADLAVLLLDRPLVPADKLPKLTRGEYVKLKTKLMIVGRVRDGTPSRDKLFKAPVERFKDPRNIYIYAGFPRTVEPGDSGGPVYVAGEEDTIVAIIVQRLGRSRRFVARDSYLPITAKGREWILKQIPK